jgi:cytochrome d ubiquinol oxidase subunit II
MLCTHGAIFLQLRTAGVIAERARSAARWLGLALIAAFATGGAWVSGIDGHLITSMPDPGGVVTPLRKTVELVHGGWLTNYREHAWMLLAPISGFAGIGLALLFSARRASGAAFACSAFGVSGIVLTAGLGLFPFMLPSSINPAVGLTVWDACSSRSTLAIMLVVVAVFLPVVLAYTAWVYRVLRGKLTPDTIVKETHTAY